ncbi:MAG: 4-hydroxythreonine-4-phosphate dehydrogenase PdxA [Verrucomicrobiota bacterium JB023]|nr:4-hydroxythreonine-4-phosphate dehydrogenase PdxA [Verrucomicrobiota bacterium JB023]
MSTAITIGDPAGIGPELALRILNDPPTGMTPVLVGDWSLLQRVSATTGIPANHPVLDLSSFTQKPPNTPAVLNIPLEGLDQLPPGLPTSLSGDAAYQWLTTAIDLTMAGTFDALVTCPLSKEAMNLAGHHYDGHTEILVERTKASQHAMMLTSPEVTATLVTTHTSLASVPQKLTTERILEVTRLTAEVIPRLYPEAPSKRNIAILGLNPHAGENGLFGEEEATLIEPAIALLKKEGLPIIGPLPADTAFINSLRPTIAAHIAMYHDQGLIPLKTLSFDHAVNVTLGLPIVRTSPDHGTAYNLAWQGEASDTSLRAACEIALRLAQ